MCVYLLPLSGIGQNGKSKPWSLMICWEVLMFKPHVDLWLTCFPGEEGATWHYGNGNSSANQDRLRVNEEVNTYPGRTGTDWGCPGQRRAFGCLAEHYSQEWSGSEAHAALSLREIIRQSGDRRANSQQQRTGVTPNSNISRFLCQLTANTQPMVIPFTGKLVDQSMEPLKWRIN